ncbi:DEAD/DEAH box helicase, partial [Burkholderia gladioli]
MSAARRRDRREAGALGDGVDVDPAGGSAGSVDTGRAAPAGGDPGRAETTPP